MEGKLELAGQARRARLHRRAAGTALIAAVLLLCAGVTVLLIVPYAVGNTTFSPLVKKTGGLGGATLLLLVAIVLDLVLAGLYVPGLLRDRTYYGKLTARATEYDVQRLAVFMNVLEGARLRAGAAEPPIVVLASAAPNALTFAGHGGVPVIGVTRGLLETDLSYAEAEAVMAHQLAGIITGDYLARPGAFGFETVTYLLLGLFSILALAAAPMVRVGSGAGAGVAFLVVAAALLLLGGFAARRLKRPDAKDYVPADAFAAAVTGKPDELAGAITKLDRLVNGRSRGRFPDNELGLKYFFAPQYRFADTAAQFVARRHRELETNPREAMVARQVEGVQQAMDELAAWGEQLVLERVEALGPGVRS
jgi:Zn-dependent protease with chaperone function